MNEAICRQIFASLNHAVENGYELHEWPAEKIAEDLHEYDSAMELYTVQELLPYVDLWLHGHH